MVICEQCSNSGRLCGLNKVVVGKKCTSKALVYRQTVVTKEKIREVDQSRTKGP